MNDLDFLLPFGQFGILVSAYMAFMAIIHYRQKPLVLTKNQRMGIYLVMASPIWIPGFIGLLRWLIPRWSNWVELANNLANPILCVSSILLFVFILTFFVFDDFVVLNMTSDTAMELLRKVLASKNVAYEEWSNRAGSVRLLGYPKYHLHVQGVPGFVVISSPTLLSARIRFRRKWLLPVQVDFKTDFLEHVHTQSLPKVLHPLARWWGMLNILGAIFLLAFSAALIYLGTT